MMGFRLVAVAAGVDGCHCCLRMRRKMRGIGWKCIIIEYEICIKYVIQIQYVITINNSIEFIIEILIHYILYLIPYMATMLSGKQMWRRTIRMSKFGRQQCWQ